MDKKKFSRCEEYWRNTLIALRGKVKKVDFVGFDVETFGDTNEFMSGGLFYYRDGVEVFEYFTDKFDMLDFICSKRFRNKYVVATNLGFDFTTLFWDTKFWNSCSTITRGSDILMVKYNLGSNNGSVKFIDTFNFVKYSVANLGKIIGSSKLEKPVWLGERKPLNSLEEFDLKMYNRMDCKITCDFMYFLQDGINVAGGNLKVTIASTSLDVWRRGHLKMNITKESFIMNDDEVRDFIFRGFYGGRTEVFRRGFFKKGFNSNGVWVYDVNSLYPSVMRKAFPVPHSIKKVDIPSISYILNYEGVTECEVFAPDNLNIPLLPLKADGKLVFPLGNFRGVWNNVELRKAISLGYKLVPIKQYIYTELFYPFKSFVEEFYSMRKDFQKNNNPMEMVMKLLLNSLFGKFSQRNRQKLSIKRICDLDEKEYMKYLKNDDEKPSFTFKDGILIDIKKSDFNGIFSFPILSSYVTSYARLLMYDYLERFPDVIYMDTDSIMIENPLNDTGKELGDMKLEYYSDISMFIKPKMYYLFNVSDKEFNLVDINNFKDFYVLTYDINLLFKFKIKGISRCNLSNFNDLLRGGGISKMKFTKLRESIRRGMKPNTKIWVEKFLDLEDTKRVWSDIFNPFEIQRSSPLYFESIGEDNFLVNSKFGIVDNRSFKEEIDYYLKNNSYLKSKYKGRIRELRIGLREFLIRGVSLDLVDINSFSNDKPFSEYVEDYFSIGGV